MSDDPTPSSGITYGDVFRAGELARDQGNRWVEQPNGAWLNEAAGPPGAHDAAQAVVLAEWDWREQARVTVLQYGVTDGQGNVLAEFPTWALARRAIDQQGLGDPGADIVLRAVSGIPSRWQRFQ